MESCLPARSRDVSPPLPVSALPLRPRLFPALCVPLSDGAPSRTTLLNQIIELTQQMAQRTLERKLSDENIIDHYTGFIEGLAEGYRQSDEAMELKHTDELVALELKHKNEEMEQMARAGLCCALCAVPCRAVPCRAVPFCAVRLLPLQRVVRAATQGPPHAPPLIRPFTAP